MIRKIFNILFILILYINICGAASNTNLRKDNRMQQGLVEFIEQRNGKVVWTGEALKYNIEVDGRKAIIDFSSDKNIKNTMKALFPETIFIRFTFLNVFPNCDIFIENREYGKTDKFGNFNNGDYFDTEPGLHHIKLVKDNKITSKTELSIFGENDVTCSGESQMECK